MFSTRQKPFPTAPKKLKNYIYKGLTDEREYRNNRYEYRDKYEFYMEEYSKRSTAPSQLESMKLRIDEFMYGVEREEYETKIRRKEWSIQDAETDIRIGIEYDDFVKPEIGYRLLHNLEEWKRKYGANEKEWKAFTDDEQNVHTKVVSDQMNTSLKILLSIPIPETQSTLDEIATAFANELGADSRLHDVYQDMKHWGNVSEIFQKGDYLYRRILRGLWSKLKTYEGEIRRELIKRLWEECSEAAGLCATGHISRLTNVLVGYDENFQSQISIQEMFQNAMVNIRQMNISIEEKHSMAKKTMDDMNIPHEERDAWLDAL